MEHKVLCENINNHTDILSPFHNGNNSITVSPVVRVFQPKMVLNDSLTALTSLSVHSRNPGSGSNDKNGYFVFPAEGSGRFFGRFFGRCSSNVFSSESCSSIVGDDTSC